MKEYATEAIRNVALIGHGSAGKTTLVEAFLHFTGAATRLGKIEDGTTVSDFDEEEIRRRISLSTSAIPLEFQDCKINLLDTPGFPDFVGEVISALRVASGAMVLIDSVAGVEVGTELTWQYCTEFKLPRFVVIAKMDRENANFEQALASAKSLPGAKLIPVQLPIGQGQHFQGVVDLLAMKARMGAGKEAAEIPAELKAAAEEARVVLMEAAAEGEDELLEKYLGGTELTQEEMIRGLRQAVWNCTCMPVFACAGSAEVGIEPLLYCATKLIPSPAETPKTEAEGKDGREELECSDAGPLAVYVWKTTADPFVGKQTFFRVYSGTMVSDTRVWNSKKSVEERLGTISLPRGKETLPVKHVHAGDIGVVPKLSVTTTGDTLCDKGHPLTFSVPAYPTALYSVAVTPKTQADAAKITPTLTRLCEEDMTLTWHNEASTLQTILQGMGDQHIDVAIRRAETKFQVGLNIELPKVPYRETITKQNSAMYRHKKQTGGSGQFGEVHLRVEPLPENDFEFENEVFGGAISSSYMSAIEKGIRAVMQRGAVAGYPMEKIKVAVFDGKEHPVDSKPVAFEIAGREAFKLAVNGASPVLLEPIMNIKVTVPEANMGDVMGDLNTRRARVQGIDTEGGKSIVNATIPLAEIQRYTTDLRSITGGRGMFSMTFDHYEVVPRNVAEPIIAAHQKAVSGKAESEE
ncbi:MAG: elongation factor G [Anaerolineales bacterium]|nr:elongation factor G [Anaerolineales bacterium]